MGRHEFQHNRLRLQAAIEWKSSRSAFLEDELRRLAGEVQDQRRLAAGREAENVTHQAGEDSLLKGVQEDLAACKSRTREVLEQRARIEDDAALAKERAVDV